MARPLPDDLSRVRTWARNAATAAWTLVEGKSAAWPQLVDGLLCSPVLPASLEAELCAASDHYCSKQPLRVGAAWSRHILDAIHERCWQALEHVHQGKLEHLQFLLAVHGQYPDKDSACKVDRWVSAVRAFDEIKHERDALQRHRSGIACIFEEFPSIGSLSGRPRFDAADLRLNGPLVCLLDRVRIIFGPSARRSWAILGTRRASTLLRSVPRRIRHNPHWSAPQEWRQSRFLSQRRTRARYSGC